MKDKPIPLAERITSRVNVTPTGHWDWQGYIDQGGYGRISVDGVATYPHRVAYTAFIGPIPPGKEIHHLCRRKACCAPDHLVAISHRSNLLADDTLASRNVAKTHCPAGHIYDAANTRFGTGKYATSRYCRACNRNQKRKEYWAMKTDSALEERFAAERAAARALRAARAATDDAMAEAHKLGLTKTVIARRVGISNQSVGWRLRKRKQAILRFIEEKS